MGRAIVLNGTITLVAIGRLSTFWFIKIWLSGFLDIGVVGWLIVGGYRDLRALFKTLAIRRQQALAVKDTKEIANQTALIKSH